MDHNILLPKEVISVSSSLIHLLIKLHTILLYIKKTIVTVAQLVMSVHHSNLC